MKFLNKETLIDAASLGVGVVAGRAATNVVASKLGAKVPALSKPLVANLTPVAGGILALILAPDNRYVQGIANGMFASAGAFYVDYALNKAGVNLTGGAGDNAVNGVFMNGVGESDVFMGNAETGTDDYASDSYDFTSASTGEMDF
jgi:hypothetical protein